MSEAVWTVGIDPEDGGGTLAVELRARDTGAGSPTLLCLHGFGDNLQTWQALRTLEERRGARVAAVDLPGFGASPLPARLAPAYVANAIRIARALVERLAGAGGPLVVVGHSLGGALALACAARGAPEVDAYLLLAPATPHTRTPTFVHLLHGPTYRWCDALMRRLPRRGRLALARGAARATFRTVVAPGFRPQPGWWDATVASFLRPGAFLDLEAAARDLLWMLSGDPSPASELLRGLERLSTPVAIVRGDRDRVIGAGEIAALARRIPHARVHALPGVAHCPQNEAPERCAEILADLLGAR